MDAYRRLSRIYGAIAPLVHELVSRDIDGLVDEIILEAVARWRAAKWHRFDDLEINCTIQLYRWIIEAGRSIPALRILAVQLEWFQPTHEMMAGLESAANMRRPDLRISIGQSAARSLECKRLALRDSFPKRYVDEGMYRFVSGSYATEEDRAAMIGYVQADDPHEIVVAVNGAIDVQMSMGETHRLHPRERPQINPHTYESNHVRSQLGTLSLFHYLVDLRLAP